MNKILLVLGMLVIAGCVSPAVEPEDTNQSSSSGSSSGSSSSGDTTSSSTSSTSSSSSTTSSSSPSSSSTSSSNSSSSSSSSSNDSTPTPAPEPAHPDWGSPESRTLRPGVNSVFQGSGCTTNFVYHENYERYFIGSAAHCATTDSSDSTNGCERIGASPGSMITLDLTSGGSVQLPIAYNSWETMARVGETNGDACSANDFMLIEVPAEQLHLLHPATLHFEGPTALATECTTQIWGYGASSLKLGIDPVHPKEGACLGTINGNWGYLVYLVTPGIPGDSGGMVYNDNGEALGVASVIYYAPYVAANRYTNVQTALQYIETHEDRKIEVVTWDNFNPTLTGLV